MILEGSEFSQALFNSISECQKSVTLCSAFIKEKALSDKRFVDKLKGKNVVVVARWQKHDILFGASDLNVYELCKKHGWQFGVDLCLHAKLFLIDDKEIFLGSANLTSRGLHLGLIGNHEFGTKISAEHADLSKVNRFIDSEVIWMNDDLFEMISEEIAQSKHDKVLFSNESWSFSIKNILHKPVQFLWVQELVFSSPWDLLNIDLNNSSMAHDFELLELNIDGIDEHSIRRNFRRSRLYQWLISVLTYDGVSFGGLTSMLHNSILDDPKPYRLDIKRYNKVIFDWAKFLGDEFEIKKPNHSEILVIK